MRLSRFGRKIESLEVIISAVSLVRKTAKSTIHINQTAP